MKMRDFAILALATVAALSGGTTAHADHFVDGSPWDGPWVIEFDIGGGGPCLSTWPPLKIDVKDGTAKGWYREPTHGGWQYNVHLDAEGRVSRMHLAGIVILAFKGRFVQEDGKGTLSGGLEGYNCKGTWTARHEIADAASGGKPLAVAERLQEVRDLLARGLITEQEAAQKRQKILDDL